MRLFPPPAQELPGEGIYEDLELPPERAREAWRPYVVINMVSSVDGRTAVEGRSSGIGGEVDRQTMRTLRSKAGAVMIGAGTLRAEKLSLALDDRAAGHQPLAIIVSRTGDVPFESNLLVGEGQEVFMITAQDASDDLENRLHEGVRVLRVRSATSSGGVDLRAALATLKGDHAVDLLLVEGGPTLNHALISSSLADELFLTLAPKLLGGTPENSPGVLDGVPLPPVQLKLLSVYSASCSELFLRYALTKDRPGR